MEPPEQVNPTSLADYFEVLTKAVFQSGMSWKVVEAKWPGFRAAFHEFDPAAVAAFSPDDIDRLCADPRIIRNRRKVEATVTNAATMLAADHEYGGFAKYLRAHGGFDATAADLKKRFKFVGDLAAYYLLYVVGEPVPPHEEWMATRGVTMERRRPPSTQSLPRPRGAEMCRSIKTLRGQEPAPTDEEVVAAALQFVRKISGYRKPSQKNAATFDAAVADVAEATRRLLAELGRPTAS